MKALRVFGIALTLLSMSAAPLRAQADGQNVHAQLLLTKAQEKRHPPAAVLWLKPVKETSAAPFTSSQSYTLLQKNRTFKPHLLIIPVGTVVRFPNADPFFHNVFSLFDGKRFDLGLYEAGSTKSVTFSREGVSYIFCNIHPEMSAVILTLSSRLFAVAGSSGEFQISDVPSGDYEMQVWIEGVPQPTLNRLTRQVHVGTGAVDLGKIEVPGGVPLIMSHKNMYGQSYDRDAKPTY